MPSTTYVNGSSTARPGVYADVNASSLAGRALLTNVLAIVGDFPALPTATPTTFSTHAALKQFFANSYEAQFLAKCVFDPANDDRIAGAPSRIVMVNGGTSTAALRRLLDANGETALTLEAKQAGPVGNTAVVDASVTTGDGRTVSVTVAGTTRTWTVEELELATIDYGGSFLTTATYDYKDTSATKLTITQEKTGIATGALSLPSGGWKFDGVPTFALSTGAVGADATLTVSGVKKDGSVFTNLAVVWNDGGTTAPDTNPLSAVEVASFTAVSFAPAAAETAEVSGLAFDIDLTDTDSFLSLKDVVDYIDSFDEWDGTVLSPLAGSIPPLYGDAEAAAAISGAGVGSLSADLYRLYLEMAGSDLVYVTLGDIETTALEQIADTGGPANFAGGGFTAGDATSVGNAYTALQKFSDVTTVLHTYTDLATQQVLRSHCEWAAGVGKGERNGWVALPAGSTKVEVASRTAALNTRHLSVFAQEVRTADHLGATVWGSPVFGAAMLAGMQCGSPVGEPQTWKIANVLDVRTDSSWDGDADAEELLRHGLVFLTTDRLGFKVERGITSYQTDDNPVWSETSAVESLNYSVRDLRQNLESQVGRPGFQSTPAVLRSLTKARLDWQVRQGIIKAYASGSVSIDDLGDAFRVNYQAAVIEPTNFITVAPYITRMPFAA